MPKLAIDGGQPVRSTPLPYGKHTIQDEDLRSVERALRSNWLTTGPLVEEFEQAFAEKVGAKFAVAVSSGTAALHSAAYAAGVGSPDEAIVPAITFVASSNCLLYQGAKPVFADILPGTLNVDPDSVRRLINDRTRALIGVDYAGQPCDIESLRGIAREAGLIFIEDAAHSLGAEYRGQTVGSLADLTVFSTHPVKQVTTGEGGVVTTNDEAAADRLRMFRNHGINSDLRQRESSGAWEYDMTLLGYNYRLSDFQSALGASQLRRLDEIVERRTELASLYAAHLGDIDTAEPLKRVDGMKSAWHLYVVRLKLEKLRTDRSQVLRALRAENIMANVHYRPVPSHSYYKNLGYTTEHIPAAMQVYEQILTLPLFPSMTEGDVEDVIQAFKKVIDAYRA